MKAMEQHGCGQTTSVLRKVHAIFKRVLDFMKYEWRTTPSVTVVSDSTVLVRTLVDSHQRFRNLIKTHGRTALDE
jgi:hypothetical protein